MGGVDRDAAGLFFRCSVNFGVIRELGPALVGENLGDGGGQGGFAMVDVTLGFVPELVTVKQPDRKDTLPMVPMFICGFARENLEAATSA